MSHNKVLSLLEAASSALSAATHIMKEYSSLPLPPSPPSPISPSFTSLNDVVDYEDISWPCEGYVFDEGIYLTEGEIDAAPKVWCVPGDDELGELVEGHLAKVAVVNGTYGISISRSGTQGPTEEVRGPLGYCLVDKERWTVAKDISIGDIFYMADSTNQIVYRGIVTAQPVAGPFCSIRSLENSFAACLGLVPDDNLKKEVELVFKVDWKVHSHIGHEWEAFFELVGKGVSRVSEE